MEIFSPYCKIYSEILLQEFSHHMKNVKGLQKEKVAFINTV